jgi:hypothetical protein
MSCRRARLVGRLPLPSRAETNVPYRYPDKQSSNAECTKPKRERGKNTVTAFTALSAASPSLVPGGRSMGEEKGRCGHRRAGQAADPSWRHVPIWAPGQ